jgi:hypothetical protein
LRRRWDDSEVPVDLPAPEDDRRPVRALAAAVLLQAVRDARAGDSEAIVWVTDPRAVEFWAVAAERSAEQFARRAAWVLGGVPSPARLGAVA